MPTDSQPDRPIQPYPRCSHIVRFSIGSRRGLRGFGVYVPFFHCAQFFPLPLSDGCIRSPPYSNVAAAERNIVFFRSLK